VLQGAVAQTDVEDSVEAGKALGSQIALALDGAEPDAVIVFASSRYHYEELLTALDAACTPRALVGCSSAGEFTSEVPVEGAACALALCSDEMCFTPALGRNLSEGREAAAQSIASALGGMETEEYRYRTALVLADALPGYTDEFLEHLTRLTAGTYQFAGGGAGDDANFSSTHVFFGTEAVPDAAVVLEILSNKPIGVGVRHGWTCASEPMRVTEAEGTTLISLNAVPAVEMVEAYARSTNQPFDRGDPVPFFLHNVLGVQTGEQYKLRVPLAVNDDGSLHCASDVPAGAVAHIMKTDVPSARDAAAAAARDAVSQLGGQEPQLALFFDCVATRLRTGREFGFELEAVRRALGNVQFAGCNTYGQIARAAGQFNGFHNCTAVVCVFPQ
jgi:hypothetical protein